MQDRRQAAILTTADVAEKLGWDTQRTRRWLMRTGAGSKVGGRVITTPSMLASHFPELLHEIVFDIGDGREL